MSSNLAKALVAVTTLFGFAQLASAASVTYSFSFENDGAVSCASPSCGTLTITEVAGGLKFTIEGNETLFGANTDVHEFGFNLNESNFAGTIFLNPLSQSQGGVPLSLTYNDKVPGRNSNFDYVVSFGNGSPYLNPVEFFIGASTDGGVNFGLLTLAALSGANISTQDSKLGAQFMVHLQTTTGVATSEAVGGTYTTPVPLPAAAWLLLSGLAGMGVVARRRKA